MSLPIELGSVLGGRYQVTAQLLTTAEGDRVLQGQDDLLDRRVSVVVPAERHEELLVANARRIASGAGHDRFQILDLGQSEDGTYLVTSYAPAANLLDALLVETGEAEDYSLSDDIFGGARAESSSDYVYDVLEPTESTPAVDGSSSRSGQGPAVTRWDGDDYSAFENSPPPPRVRNRLGFARKVRPEDMRTTLFERAAGSTAAGAAAGSALHRIDPTHDGDNRYSSFEASEGNPDRLAPGSTPGHDDAAPATAAHGTSDERPAPDEFSGPDGPPTEETAPVTDPVAADEPATVQAAAVPSAETQDEVEDTRGTPGEDLEDTGRVDPVTGDREHHHSAGAAAAAGAGATAAAAAGHSGHRDRAPEEDRYQEPSHDDPSEGERHDGHGAGGSSASGSRKGPLRALILMLLVLALLAAVVLGFKGLGSLAGSFGEHQGDDPSRGGDPTASSAPSDGSGDGGAAPEATAAKRVTSDPSVMTDTDATLGQAVDGNPSTYWMSYGFSDEHFGGLLEHAGLAVELEEPARVNEVSIDQSGGTGGSFRVYVADEPSVDGAQEVGSGSFTGPQITVPLSDAAKNDEHRYVLVVWDELPQLSNPIGGYPYGLRIGEVTPR